MSCIPVCSRVVSHCYNLSAPVCLWCPEVSILGVRLFVMVMDGHHLNIYVCCWISAQLEDQYEQVKNAPLPSTSGEQPSAAGSKTRTATDNESDDEIGPPIPANLNMVHSAYTLTHTCTYVYVLYIIGQLRNKCGQDMHKFHFE